MSSLFKRYRSGRPDTGELMPPNPLTFGAAPFGDAQRTRLTAWLRERAGRAATWRSRSSKAISWR